MRLAKGLPKSLNNLRTEISLQTNSPIEIKLSDICFNCGGTGRLKVMKNMAVIGGGSVRGPDTIVKCNFCNGTGRK